ILAPPERARRTEGMLSVEDWAEIRRLHVAERMPIKQIARQLGISKNTVKAKLAADAAPGYRRAGTGSAVDEVEPRIRRLLSQTPTMPATVIAERVGWSRGMTVLTGRVRELRPVYLPPDPSSRTAYVAGEIAQNDFWFPDIELPVGYGQSRTADAVAGVDDGQRVLADAVRPAAADPHGAGSVRGVVAAPCPVGCGAPGAGLGRGGRGRSVRPGPQQAHRRVSGVPRHVGHPGGGAAAAGPGGERDHRAGP